MRSPRRPKGERSVRGAHRIVAGGAGLALLALAGQAQAADRVAVLRFSSSGGGTTSANLDAARSATREAVEKIHDVLPTDKELAAGEATVKDHVPDTSAEYRAAGGAAGAQWTVAGHVDAHGPTYRLELEVCQVSTGRVESLAREVDGRQASAQIAEMLGLLLRPQGVGDTVPPWEGGPPEPVAPPPAPTPVTPPPPTPAPAPVAEPATPASPPAPYAEDHPFAVGLGDEIFTFYARNAHATGSPVAMLIGGQLSYAIAAAPGLEVLADFGVAFVGPSSIRVAFGARYEFPVVPKVGLFVGPEATLGAFVTEGGVDHTARFLVKGSIPIVWRIVPRFQMEAFPLVAYAAGGSEGLGFAGGGLRGVLRF